MNFFRQSTSQKTETSESTGIMAANLHQKMYIVFFEVLEEF